LGIEVGKGGGKNAALSVKMAVGCIGVLLPPLVWRCYVLLVKPDLLGKYRDEGEVDANDRMKGTKCE
jgi:hypothetical protein